MASHEDLDTGEATVIYINASQRVEWNNEDTKEVMRLYDEKLDMFESGTINTQKKLWELVSKDMAKSGYYYTAVQCENKWKALKRSYRNKMEEKEKYGSCKRTCPFEDEITEILRKRPRESMNGLYTPRKKFRRNDGTLEKSLNNSDGSSDDNDSSEGVQKIELGNVHCQPLENTEYIIQDASQNQIVEELSELRKVVNKHIMVNSEHLRQTNNTNSQIVRFLEGSTQRESESLALRETRIELQNEVIKQMKIHNSLIQKLLEKKLR